MSESPGYRMPLPLLQPRTFDAVLGDLFDAPQRERQWQREGHPAQRYIMGMPVPTWQRGLVWSEAQQQAFVESAWLGLHLGMVVINGVRRDQGTGQVHALSGLLLDGQQRLAAIDAYLGNRFPVCGHYWRELPPHEQARFSRTPFTRCEVSLWHEGRLRDLYDRMNFGGTAHAPHERAAAKTNGQAPGA